MLWLIKVKNEWWLTQLCGCERVRCVVCVNVFERATTEVERQRFHTISDLFIFAATMTQTSLSDNWHVAHANAFDFSLTLTHSGGFSEGKRKTSLLNQLETARLCKTGRYHRITWKISRLPFCVYWLTSVKFKSSESIDVHSTSC